MGFEKEKKRRELKEKIDLLFQIFDKEKIGVIKISEIIQKLIKCGLNGTAYFTENLFKTVFISHKFIETEELNFKEIYEFLLEIDSELIKKLCVASKITGKKYMRSKSVGYRKYSMKQNKITKLKFPTILEFEVLF